MSGGAEHRCATCTATFKTAGRLEDHRATVHWDEGYEPLRRDELLRRAVEYSDRLGGVTLGVEDVVRGVPCDDCGKEPLRLWELGRFACCYRCARLRTNAKRKAA